MPNPPARRRTRPNGLRARDHTAAAKRAWLAAFRNELTITAACAAVDVGRTTVYVLMGWDPWLVLVAICRPCHEATHGFRIPRGRRRRGTNDG